MPYLINLSSISSDGFIGEAELAHIFKKDEIPAPELVKKFYKSYFSEKEIPDLAFAALPVDRLVFQVSSRKFIILPDNELNRKLETLRKVF